MAIQTYPMASTHRSSIDFPLCRLARHRPVSVSEARSLPIVDPPDRGYDEHQARAALQGLIGSSVHGIRVFTLDELDTSDDGRDVHADLAIELWLDSGESVALFHWGVNFRVEQLCVWRQPLTAIWPSHAESPAYDLPRSWPGWPRGRLRAVEAFKLRPSEVGIHRADLHFEHGGMCIKTGGLRGDEADSLVLSPLD
jgi:hypothetical protein